MKQKIIGLLLGVIGTSSFSQAPTSYLCVADKAAGFGFDKVTKQWVQENFHTENKYVISRSAQKGITWDVKVVGEKYSLTGCSSDFNSVGNLFCHGHPCAFPP